MSTYDRSEPLGGSITLESDAPMLFKLLPEEGFNFSKKVFSGSFEFSNSGGCRNFDTYNMNPAFCVKVVQDPTQIFFRLMIKGEVS